MPWSDQARVMIHPFQVYRELGEAAPGRALRTVVEEALFVLFVIGAFVSLTSAGRFVPFHIASTMIFWSFLPAIQMALFAAVLRLLQAPSNRDRGVTLGVALYFAGYGPWLVFFMALAGICLFVPDVYIVMRWLLAHGVLPGMLLAVVLWSGLLTFACLHAGLGLSRRRAGLATALFYTGFVSVIVAYYLSMNQIQPQLPGPA